MENGSAGRSLTTNDNTDCAKIMPTINDGNSPRLGSESLASSEIDAIMKVVQFPRHSSIQLLDTT